MWVCVSVKEEVVTMFINVYVRAMYVYLAKIYKQFMEIAISAEI